MGCNTRFPLNMKISFLVLLLLMFLWFQESETKLAHRKHHHKKHPKLCGLTHVDDECDPRSKKYKLAHRKHHHKKHHHKKHPKLCGLTHVDDECDPRSKNYKKCCDKGLSCLPKRTQYVKIRSKKGRKAYKVNWIYTCQKPILEEEEMEEMEEMKEKRTNQID